MLALGFAFWEDWELNDKVTFNMFTRIITVNPNVTDLDIKADIYSASKRWLLVDDNNKIGQIVRVIGGDDTIGVFKAGDIYFLVNGWRLQVDLGQTAMTGTLFSDDFDTPLIDFSGGQIFSNFVSNLVSTVKTTVNVVTGDISTVPTSTQNADAVWNADNSIVTNASGFGAMLGQVERAVHVDTEQIVNGDGSQSSPFNNLNDTLTYAESEGLKIIHVLADITIDRNLKNFIVIGIGGAIAIDCNGNDLNKTRFKFCTMRGQYTGSIIVQDSVLDNNFYLNGFFNNCVLKGDLFCTNGAEVLLMLCASFVQGDTTPSISMVAAGTCELGVRFYSGGIELRDMNNASDKCSIEPTAGNIILASSCTGIGSLSLKGTSDLVNNSTLTNISDKLIKSEDIGFIKDMDSGKWHIVDDQMIFYASDNVTEVSRFNLFDSAGNPTTTGEVFKRERV